VPAEKGKNPRGKRRSKRTGGGKAKEKGKRSKNICLGVIKSGKRGSFEDTAGKTSGRPTGERKRKRGGVMKGTFEKTIKKNGLGNPLRNLEP